MSRLTIDEYVCHSCAVGSIANVGSCQNAEMVMRRFCELQLGTNSGYRKNYPLLNAFYVFCAGPEVKSNEKGGTGHSVDHWPRYGTEFAQYLIDNGLGGVATLPAKKNAKHHPTSTAQTWLWSPDQTAVEKWWTDLQARDNAGGSKLPANYTPSACVVDDDNYDEEYDEPYEDEDYLPDDDY
jgi:hypothetical protein